MTTWQEDTIVANSMTESTITFRGARFDRRTKRMMFGADIYPQMGSKYSRAGKQRRRNWARRRRLDLAEVRIVEDEIRTALIRLFPETADLNVRGIASRIAEKRRGHTIIPWAVKELSW